MKQRPMTWVWWIELILGALLPTMVFGPYLLYGVAFSLGSHDLSGAWMAFVSLGTLLSLWVLVLLGPGWIHRHPGWRWFTMVMLILGFVVVLYYTKSLLIPEWRAVFNLVSRTHVHLLMEPVRFGAVLFAFDYRFNTVALLGAVAVGLRYLPQLLRGSK